MLEAGVMEEGQRFETEVGTPQGGVISPLLANVYLHYVVDLWFSRVVKVRCQGEAYLVRYADDFVACFQYEAEARAFRKALDERLGKFHLEIEATKTRVMRFGRFAKRDAEARGERVAVFDFLGFTHYCGTSRAGRFKLKWRSSTKRLRVKTRAMRDWLRSNLCMPLAEVWQSVNRRLRGHYAYFNVSDNWSGVMEYRRRAEAALFWALNRRSQSQSFNWAAFFSYADRHGLAMPGRVVNLNPVPSV
jgi:hypothetical protein